MLERLQSNSANQMVVTYTDAQLRTHQLQVVIKEITNNSFVSLTFVSETKVYTYLIQEFCAMFVSVGDRMKKKQVEKQLVAPSERRKQKKRKKWKKETKRKENL